MLTTTTTTSHRPHDVVMDRQEEDMIEFVGNDDDQGVAAEKHDRNSFLDLPLAGAPLGYHSTMLAFVHQQEAPA